jgi:hypothetical protein
MPASSAMDLAMASVVGGACIETMRPPGESSGLASGRNWSSRTARNVTRPYAPRVEQRDVHVGSDAPDHCAREPCPGSDIEHPFVGAGYRRACQGISHMFPEQHPAIAFAREALGTVPDLQQVEKPLNAAPGVGI